jgi:hypothetical protein
MNFVQVATLLKETVPSMFPCPVDDITPWLTWAYEQGFLLTVSGDAGEVIGLMVARPVSQPPLVSYEQEFDEDGKFLHVEVLLAPTANIWRGLHTLLINRFPYQDTMSSKRLGGPIKTHNIKKATKALLRRRNLWTYSEAAETRKK